MGVTVVDRQPVLQLRLLLYCPALPGNMEVQVVDAAVKPVTLIVPEQFSLNVRSAEPFTNEEAVMRYTTLLFPGLQKDIHTVDRPVIQAGVPILIGVPQLMEYSLVPVIWSAVKLIRSVAEFRVMLNLIQLLSAPGVPTQLVPFLDASNDQAVSALAERLTVYTVEVPVPHWASI